LGNLLKLQYAHVRAFRFFRELASCGIMMQQDGRSAHGTARRLFLLLRVVKHDSLGTTTDAKMVAFLGIN